MENIIQDEFQCLINTSRMVYTLLVNPYTTCIHKHQYTIYYTLCGNNILKKNYIYSSTYKNISNHCCRLKSFFS